MMLKRTYYLNLGSNLDDREGNLWAADLRLALDVGLVTARSAIVESSPWGFTSSNNFLNVGLAVESHMEPEQVLEAIHNIERELCHGLPHRDRNGAYIDRLLDIDIMAIDQLVINTPGLTVPHPQLPNRAFFLKPLDEIAPQWKHPILKLTAKQMLNRIIAAQQ